VIFTSCGGGRGKVWQRYELAKMKHWIAPSVVLKGHARRLGYWLRLGGMNISRSPVYGERRNHLLREGVNFIKVNFIKVNFIK